MEKDLSRFGKEHVTARRIQKIVDGLISCGIEPITDASQAARFALVLFKMLNMVIHIGSVLDESVTWLEMGVCRAFLQTRLDEVLNENEEILDLFEVWKILCA